MVDEKQDKQGSMEQRQWLSDPQFGDIPSDCLPLICFFFLFDFWLSQPCSFFIPFCIPHTVRYSFITAI